MKLKGTLWLAASDYCPLQHLFRQKLSEYSYVNHPLSALVAVPSQDGSCKSPHVANPRGFAMVLSPKQFRDGIVPGASLFYEVLMDPETH